MTNVAVISVVNSCNIRQQPHIIPCRQTRLLPFVLRILKHRIMNLQTDFIVEIIFFSVRLFTKKQFLRTVYCTITTGKPAFLANIDIRLSNKRSKVHIIVSWHCTKRCTACRYTHQDNAISHCSTDILAKIYQLLTNGLTCMRENRKYVSAL